MAGVQVPAGAVAELALLLERAGEAGLAQRIGIAYDRDSRGLLLTTTERHSILSVLGEASPRLDELRAALAQAGSEHRPD